MSAAIQYVMGQEVRLVSSAEETAADVYRTLVEHGLERTATDPAHPPLREHRRRRGRVPRARRAASSAPRSRASRTSRPGAIPLPLI